MTNDLSACASPSGIRKNHKYHKKDEENPLPYKDETFDLVICNLNLHWSNDLNKTLKEINRVLRPDAALIGNVTLITKEHLNIPPV